MMMQNSALTIYDDQLLEFINTDFEIKLLDNQCNFSEGPVWNKEGFYLFSDIPENVIYKIDETGSKEIYLQQSGCSFADTSMLSDQPGSNGLAYDAEGSLLICQHGNGAVARYDGSKIETIISSYNNKRFNSPNDIIVSKDGTIFFSDPAYGLNNQQLNEEFAQPVAAIYCYRNGEINILSDQYQYPNGVCLSPNEKSLYCCSTKEVEKYVLEYDTQSLQLKGVVARENSDGIKCDRYNNLYLSTGEGILILGCNGKRLGLISFDTIPANHCWGGASGNDLLITARENIYLVKDLQKRD
jgi:gluconolactonase